jgi:hypothetical protein
MKYMIGFPIAWVVVYFMFSFIALSWSPAEWTELNRITCSIFGMVWGFALSYRMSQDCKWAY